MEDFQVALSEIRPAFGTMADTLESYRLNGIINYGPAFEHLLSSSQSIVQQACPPPRNRPLCLKFPSLLIPSRSLSKPLLPSVDINEQQVCLPASQKRLLLGRSTMCLR